MTAATCEADACRVLTFEGAEAGCPACGWPDERHPDTGMTPAEAAQWLAGASRSPRYAGPDGWRRLLGEPANVEHAAAAARRNLDPDQVPTLRAVAAQLDPTGAP